VTSRAALRPVLAFAALAVAAFALPAFVSDFHAQELSYVAVYVLALTGLDILTGYTGQISLGHGAFMAIGAYTTAILMTDHGVRDVATIPIAIAVAGAAGAVFGLPAARLTGLYLALATFAVAVAVPALILKFDGLTGGSSGLVLFGTSELTASSSPVRLLGLELNYDNWLYYLSATAALVGYVAAWLLLRGRTGRAFRAVRDSETAAVSSGIDVTRTKVLAFAISAAYCGGAGALFAIVTASVSPDAFPLTLSIFLLVGLVVSGLGSLTGLIAGAVFVQFLPQWAQGVSKSPGAPAVVYGVVLIVVVIALPGGVAGLMTRLSRRDRTFPE
jgi:branched-chain amino acid transport system permease protein